MSARPSYMREPPLEPLNQTLLRLGITYAFTSRPPLDAKADLERYRSTMWDDVDARALGNMNDLVVVWNNVIEAKQRMPALSTGVQEHVELTQRQNGAAVCVQAAAQTLEVGLLLHSAAHIWYQYPALAMTRTAIELAAKGAFIALGTGDEPGRWRSAHFIRDSRKRRAVEIKASETMPVLDTHVAVQRAGASPPSSVYRWLCSFTHFDAEAMSVPPKPEKTYAALAYVAWINATVAERVAGLQGMAVWPSRWPAKLPWQ